MGREKFGCLEKPPLEAGTAGELQPATCLALVFRERPRVEVPQPSREVTRRRTPDIEFDAGQSGGNGRLPEPRVGQVGEDAKLAHGDVPLGIPDNSPCENHTLQTPKINDGPRTMIDLLIDQF